MKMNYKLDKFQNNDRLIFIIILCINNVIFKTLLN